VRTRPVKPGKAFRQKIIRDKIPGQSLGKFFGGEFQKGQREEPVSQTDEKIRP